MIGRLALRNALRDPRRSLLTGGTIACSVALFLVGLGWIHGVFGAMSGYLLQEFGHVRVVHPDYPRRERLLTLGSPVEEAPALAARLRELAGVERVDEQIKLGAMIDLGGNVQEGSLVLAVSPARAQAMPATSTAVYAGRPFEPGAEEAVLGRVLARRLGAEVGDTVTVIANDVWGSLRGQNLEVVGLFDVGAQTLNRRLVMDLGQARRFLDMEAMATEVMVFARGEPTAAWLGRVRQAAAGEGRRVQTWQESSGLGAVFLIVAKVIFFLALILGTLASFGVLNTMMMAVLERTREIGLMGALGLRPRRIQAIFLAEALMLGLLGATLGALAGSAGALYLARVGVAIEAESLEGIDLPFPEVLRGSLEPWMVALAWALGLAVALAAAAWPAWRAARLAPAEALRR